MRGSRERELLHEQKKNAALVREAEAAALSVRGEEKGGRCSRAWRQARARPREAVCDAVPLRVSVWAWAKAWARGGGRGRGEGVALGYSEGEGVARASRWATETPRWAKKMRPPIRAYFVVGDSNSGCK